MARRHLDWMAQAKYDLKHAENSLKLGDYEWACFAAQQAAEKALKALIESRNGRALGHSLTALMEALMIDDIELVKTAARLDRFYILTRYPNGFDAGVPRDYFFQDDAERAIEDAERIISYCQSQIEDR